jgi:hypothetical protein
MSASVPNVSMAQMMIWDAVMRVRTAFVPISVVPKSGPTHSDDWELLWDTGAICPNVPTVPAGVRTLEAHLEARLRLRGPRDALDEFVQAAIAQNLRRLATLVPRPQPAQVLCIA